ncbi:MAG: hypothetical protein JSW47_12585 [Phycisphaerales bacterium]|nr:MAG: hypothetical protein JSW47_12585 [Phycisphaerales bacterium]
MSTKDEGKIITTQSALNALKAGKKYGQDSEYLLTGKGVNSDFEWYRRKCADVSWQTVRGMMGMHNEPLHDVLPIYPAIWSGTPIGLRTFGNVGEPFRSP